ncbi:ComF family protein [Marinihelvus fidelis]|uniref:ComF family protein n=1 Tax=Marinihelvus fidelis TaxID=2613842 RepID=UPI00177CD0F4|nr:ComF family protein [Marinihelvus fidelis]
MKMFLLGKGGISVGEQYLDPSPGCQPRAARWRRAGAILLDALLPAHCVLCGDRAHPGPGDHTLCRPCLHGLPGNPGACLGCGLPHDGDSRCCRDCRLRPPPWDHVMAPLRYDFPVDRLVRQLKFARDLVSGRALAAAMAFAGPPPATGRPLLVPVPMHGFRRWRRGYNQAAELSLHLARATGWPLRTGSLIRTRHTRAQSGLGKRARRHNLDGAFDWRGPMPTRATVVLVDDVMTTGSTLDACARTAYRGGAQSVMLWVAARALGNASATGATDSVDVQSARSAQRS